MSCYQKSKEYWDSIDDPFGCCNAPKQMDQREYDRRRENIKKEERIDYPSSPYDRDDINYSKH